MPGNIKVHLFCYDDHRGFSGDVRKRFSDTARYTVLSFQTRKEFIDRLKAEKNHNFCKVAILGVHDTKEQIEMMHHLTMEIKSIDSLTGIILLGTPEKMEEIEKTVKFNIEAYIPKNANSVLRIHNTVKKLTSEHNIKILKRRRNLSLWLLLGFLILSSLILLVAYFNLPEYF
jgi:hypothetical protein